MPTWQLSEVVIAAIVRAWTVHVGREMPSDGLVKAWARAARRCLNVQGDPKATFVGAAKQIAEQ
eukprot:2667913-Alexandrium_andersonii.AAC.1